MQMKDVALTVLNSKLFTFPSRSRDRGRKRELKLDASVGRAKNDGYPYRFLVISVNLIDDPSAAGSRQRVFSRVTRRGASTGYSW